MHKNYKELDTENLTESWLFPLETGQKAFAVRKALIDEADETLDIQYYIWSRDIAGLMILDAVYNAAKRGVKIRMLLDDNGIPKMDDLLSALNTFENVEIRLFNPFSFRAFKPIGYITNFRRLNHRMHNKSMTVDNCASIVGGRNIGDDYAGTGEWLQYFDLDVVAVWPIVDEVSKSFQEYWDTESSVPIEQVVKTPGTIENLESVLAENNEKLEDSYFNVALHEEDSVVQSIKNGEQPEIWSKVTLFCDNPQKYTGKLDDSELMISKILDKKLAPKKRVDLVSPYFVPWKEGTRILLDIVKKHGAKLNILTNSLASNDVTAVHGGYTRYRKKLLKNTVKLFELTHAKKLHTGKNKDKRIVTHSNTSLHAKTFAIDGEKIFIGSFNFDPRSMRINTEMGFLIESDDITKLLHDFFDDFVPKNSYLPELTQEDKVIWMPPVDSKKDIPHYTTEPWATKKQRIVAWIANKLPIEWLL